MKVIKGDNVKILSGKDRGKTGEVLQVFKGKDRVLVKGVNIVIKHTKSRGEGTPSGRIEMELPIHLSNVQVIDPSTGKPSRVGFEVKEGKKTRKFISNSKKKSKKVSTESKEKATIVSKSEKSLDKKA